MFLEELKRYQAQREFGDRRKGVTGARTFFYQGEAACEKNMEVFLRCIEAVATTTHTTGFAAIKLTALGRPQLLVCGMREKYYLKKGIRVFGKFQFFIYQCESNEL